MIYIYDLETYPNFFLASFKDIKSGKIYHFEISDRKNQTLELREFLLNKEIKYLVGFNNINFDYPVLHNTILSNTILSNFLWSSYSIYTQVEKIINTKYSSIKDRLVKIPQIDIYKIWHYDNKNKATSLKWLEFAMRMINIQDLPYPVGSHLTDEQKDETIEYCENDLDATMRFFNKSLKQLTLRNEYSKIEKTNLLNSSEIHLSKEIFSKALAIEMGMNAWDVKQLRTYRKEVEIKDIIFPYIEFKDPINQKTLDEFKSRIWIYNQDEEKALDSISFQSKYKNVIREFAEGGLHSFGKPGIYSTDDDYILIDVDFASFYPHLSFRNKLHPEHIPEPIFSKIYEGFYNNRKKYDKKDVRNYVLKIILNGSYGLSKDKYSFLYDPKWQLAICINGQLILAMLTEKILEYIPEGLIIFENTDGAMYRIPKQKLNLLNQACDEVAKIVNIPLETQECKKIIIRDVNNYINIIDDKTVKYKGAFEINRDFHKNHSKRIVPLALANYYLNNITPEETINNHFNITEYNLPMDKKANTNVEEDKEFYQSYGLFDFCIGSKMKGGNKLYARKLERFDFIDTELSKTNRYIVAKEGVELIKKLPPLEKDKLTETDKYKLKFDSRQMNLFDIIEDVKIDPKDRESNLEVGFKCQVLNILKDDHDESIIKNIDKQYYIAECYKIIDKIKE